ncbi:MAG: NACHT domain-containing protein [Cyanobacteria bacterium P01_D01_bin.56]
MEKFIKSSITNLVKWTPSGTSFSVMLHALLTQEWTQAVLISFPTACSVLWVKFSSKFMEEAEKEAEKRGGGLAKWMFVVGDRTAIALKEKTLSRWRHFTSDFEDKYYERLTYICRNYETQGLDKDQVLKLQRVFVPLKISPKSLAKISQDLIQDSPETLSQRQEIGQFLVRMASDSAFRRLAILGAPGSGKTTLLRYLTLIYTSRQQRKLLHPKAPSYIPVLMYLRDVREDIVANPKLPLVNLIHRWLQKLQELDPLVPPPSWFANKLKLNKCLILLDGLDEIADEAERRKVSQWVDFQMREYKNTAFILSSRPLGYRSAKLQQDITVLEVQPFSLKQVEQFIQNWYLETEIKSQDNNDDLGVKQEAKRQADDLVRRIQNSAPLATMAVNPLLLTMIATVHRRGSALPGKRVELYKEICQVLLEKRQRAKNLPGTLTVLQTQSALQFLAIALMHHKTRSFSLDSEINKLIQSSLALASSDVPTSTDFLRQMREVSGLLIAKEEGVYEFAHLSFQEYLASVEISRSNRESILINALENSDQLSWWAETIRLYCAQNDASSIIQTVIRSNDIATLSLAFDCLEEGASMQSSVREALETRLIQGLESDNKELFKLAAEVRLSRRLNQLLRVDEKTAIDTSYITCAEYQLFIYEQRQQGKYNQPDHWNAHHFPANTAAETITGIRANDAQVFCQWLSQRTGQHYRLPYVQEAQTHPIGKPKIGTWSLGPKSESYKLIGISKKHWQQWRSVLSDSLKNLIQEDFNNARVRAGARARAGARVRALDLGRVRDRDLSRARVRDRDRVRARDLGRDLGLGLDLVRALDLARDLARDLGLDLDLARARALVFNRDLDRDLDRDRARALDLALASVHAYLSIFLLSLELLIEIYEQGSKSQRQIIRANKKTESYNYEKKNLIQQFNNITDSYLAFAIVHLRQENKLPAWESIQIVREEEE